PLRVNELQRAYGRLDALWRIGNGPRSFHTENRAHALTSCEEAIAHGAVNGLRRKILGRDQPFELAVDELLLGGEVLAKAHALSGRNGSACSFPSFRMSISTRVSAFSSCLRQVSLNAVPFSNSSSDRSSGRSPASSSLTTFSSSSRQASKLSTG